MVTWHPHHHAIDPLKIERQVRIHVRWVKVRGQCEGAMCVVHEYNKKQMCCYGGGLIL